MNAYLKKSSVLVLSLMVFAACDLRDKMDDMHSGTQNLDNNTTELLKETRSVGAKTDQLLMTACQGGSAAHRMNSFDFLKSAENIGDKITLAGHYFASDEFQICQEFRNITDLKVEAVEELMKFVLARAPIASELDGPINLLPALSGEDGELADLLALSAAMHKVNSLQNELMGTEDNVMALLYRGLSHGLKKDLGEQVEHSELDELILFSKSHVKHLFQLRHNALAGHALLKVISKDKLKEVVGTMMQGGSLAWEPKLTNLSIEELQRFMRILGGAIQTKNLLLSLGEVPKIDNAINGVWKMMASPAKREIPSEERQVELNKKRKLILSATLSGEAVAPMSTSELRELNAPHYNAVLAKYEEMVNTLTGRVTPNKDEEKETIPLKKDEPNCEPDEEGQIDSKCFLMGEASALPPGLDITSVDNDTYLADMSLNGSKTIKVAVNFSYTDELGFIVTIDSEIPKEPTILYCNGSYDNFGSIILTPYSVFPGNNGVLSTVHGDYLLYRILVNAQGGVLQAELYEINLSDWLGGLIKFGWSTGDQGLITNFRNPPVKAPKEPKAEKEEKEPKAEKEEKEAKEPKAEKEEKEEKEPKAEKEAKESKDSDSSSSIEI